MAGRDSSELPGDRTTPLGVPGTSGSRPTNRSNAENVAAQLVFYIT